MYQSVGYTVVIGTMIYAGVTLATTLVFSGMASFI